MKYVYILLFILIHTLAVIKMYSIVVRDRDPRQGKDSFLRPRRKLRHQPEMSAHPFNNSGWDNPTSIETSKTLVAVTRKPPRDNPTSKELTASPGLRETSETTPPRKAEIIDMRDLVQTLAFDNPNGGPWKQGWRVKPKQGPLTVFVVPHSHCDPGWLKTFDVYFQQQVKGILTTVFHSLQKHPNRTFIWAEISFFEWWWREQSHTTKQEMIRLMKNKQFEFVTGGWVMNDEANTDIYAMEVQMDEGLNWIKQNIGKFAVPQYGWAIDPFGYSPTMAYVLQQRGFKGMLIQRVHYAVKKYLAKRQQLEFHWRQTWDYQGEYDIFTHMMPFYSYDPPHSCGPDPSVCCQFDFARIHGYGGCPWHKPPRLITDNNVKERAELLLDQYRKKSTLYATNVVLAPLGDDFRYGNAREANVQYENYERIMTYLNKHHPEVTIQFGTLRTYFEAVFEYHGVDRVRNVPVLQGSFFTYADRDEDYWSGYFTTRPYDKKLDRLLEASLWAADQLARLPAGLQSARRNLALFQHHDGITGTAKTHVVNDYAKRMKQSIQDTHNWMAKRLNTGLPVIDVGKGREPFSLLPKKNGEYLVFNPSDSSRVVSPLGTRVTIPANTTQRIQWTLPTCKKKGKQTTLMGPDQEEWTFDSKTGMLQSYRDPEGDVHPVKEEWRVYKVNRGGAYMFFPLGEPTLVQHASNWYSCHDHTHIVETTHWRRTARISPVSGLEMEYTVFVDKRNEEWIVRFKTNVQNKGWFHTDLNGFNFDTHLLRTDLPVQSQVFPMPRLAAIEDMQSRFTIHSDHSQGAASLHNGDIQIWLDRRLGQDDERGLGQGVQDNVELTSRLSLLYEVMKYPKTVLEYDFKPTDTSFRVWHALNRPLFFFLPTAPERGQPAGVRIYYQGTMWGARLTRQYTVGTFEQTTQNGSGTSSWQPICTVPCILSHVPTPEADIVLFHGPSTHRLPFQKKNNQKFGIHSMESERYYASQGGTSELMQHMDYQLTTKLIAQAEGAISIPSPYFSNFEYDQFMKPPGIKKGFVMWMHNNCGALSKRHDIVKNIMKHIQVDSFGSCLHTKDDDRSKSNPVELVSEYKFYLMFENVFDDIDWVSSTYFRTLAAGTVPVYKGAPNIDLFTPSDHSIIKVDDYNSIESLVEHLQYLDQNETAYGEYLQWKKDGTSKIFQKVISINDVDPFCRLCAEFSRGTSNRETIKLLSWVDSWNAAISHRALARASQTPPKQQQKPVPQWQSSTEESQHEIKTAAYDSRNVSNRMTPDAHVLKYLNTHNPPPHWGEGSIVGTSDKKPWQSYITSTTTSQSVIKSPCVIKGNVVMWKNTNNLPASAYACCPSKKERSRDSSCFPIRMKSGICECEIKENVQSVEVFQMWTKDPTTSIATLHFKEKDSGCIFDLFTIKHPPNGLKIDWSEAYKCTVSPKISIKPVKSTPTLKCKIFPKYSKIYVLGDSSAKRLFDSLGRICSCINPHPGKAHYDVNLQCNAHLTLNYIHAAGFSDELVRPFRDPSVGIRERVIDENSLLITNSAHNYIFQDANDYGQTLDRMVSARNQLKPSIDVIMLTNPAISVKHWSDGEKCRRNNIRVQRANEQIYERFQKSEIVDTFWRTLMSDDGADGIHYNGKVYDEIIERIEKHLQTPHKTWQSYITSTTSSQSVIQSPAYDSRNIWAGPDTCGSPRRPPKRPTELFEKWSKQVCFNFPKACQLFQKTLVDTWDHGITWLKDGTVFLVTGDIPLMWLRDSSAQVTHYLALSQHSSIQQLIEGVLRRQMKWIELDVYGSAFRMFLDFDHVGKTRLTDWDFKCGRTIHVAQHDYEMDSLAYVVKLAYQYWKKTGRTCWMTDVQQTWHSIVDVWILEQDHSNSNYTYPTLENNGKGTRVCQTGMSWAGMRPSDDKMKYHYNIPGQLFSTKALQYIEEMSSLWSDSNLKQKASKLRREILAGVHTHGVVDGVLVYETDGCGHYFMADDANIPSLLSLPYFGIDMPEYEKTRKFILSDQNPWWSKGGIGSPHTNGRGHPWHLAMIMEGWKDRSTLGRVLKTAYGGSLHESVTMSGGSTRNWFGWANALFSEWLLKSELNIITITSPRPSHPDITIINQTLHAMYYHNPTWTVYPHYILMDGCPHDPKYWEHKWCSEYQEFVVRLKRELNSRSTFKNVHIIEPPSWSTRMGLTGTIQNGFEKAGLAPTDLVFLQQDDTRFINGNLNLTEILRRTHKLDPPYVRLLMKGEENGQSTAGYRPEECTFSDHPHFVEARMYYNDIFPKRKDNPGEPPEFLTGRGRLSSQKVCPHLCCDTAIVEHIDGMEKYRGTWAERPRDWIHDYPMSNLRNITKIWTCGWQTKALYDYALSNMVYGGVYSGHSEPGDVLLYDWGPCPGSVQTFKGRIFWFDGENHFSWTNKIRSNDVYFGGKTIQPKTIDWTFLSTAAIGMGIIDSIVSNTRPDTIGREFLLYFQSNCVPHREKAFNAMSTINTPTSAGKCHGTISNYKSIVVSHSDWGSNVKEFRSYRFALVMENSVAPGYITEKIATAFVAGCIPIYYGHRETVNKWFNKDAFIFYNLTDPQPALRIIQHLEKDREAYQEMRSKPITSNVKLWKSLPKKLKKAVHSNKIKKSWSG